MTPAEFAARPMSLGERQRLFTRLLPRLFDYIHGQGYDVTLGEGYVGDSIDPDEDSPHRRDGGHFKRLAIDLNLFMRGEYLTTTEAHQPFGHWWEQQHALCRWGGRWGDGNHYSMLHDGVA